MNEPRELEIVEKSLSLPEMDIATAVERFKMLGQFVKEIMRPGTDYGVIPGTGKRKIMLPGGEVEVPMWTLLKPGAEKLCTFFGLTKEEQILAREMDWTGKDHGGEAFFYFHYLIRLSRNGRLVAEADGSANSWETKHRYRQGEYKCPKCHQEAIRRNKEEKGGGWYCWSKLGGCGTQFLKGSAEIEKQDVGKKKNPDPADLVNTIQKMACKRALVATTLVAVNASEYFNQDIEDLPDMNHAPPTSPASASPDAPGGTKKEKTEDDKGGTASPEDQRPDIKELLDTLKNKGWPVAKLVVKFGKNRDKWGSEELKKLADLATE